MIETIGKAGVLVALVVLGYTVKRVGWVAPSDFGVLSRILLRVTLPCALAVSFNTFDITPSLLYITAMAVAITVAQCAVGFWIARGDGRRGQAFGVLNTGAANIGLFAVPYVGAFLGPQAIVYAALFDIGNSFAGAGIAYAWALTLAKGTPVSVRGIAKTVFSSVVFDVYLALLIMGLLHLKLPAPVLAVASVAGQANTFLAMFAIGVGLEITLSRHGYVVAARHLAARYGVALVVLVGLWTLTPLDALVKLVVTLLLLAPLAAMMPGFTAEAGLDVETSTFITSVTVIVAIVAMPVAMALLGGTIH